MSQEKINFENRYDTQEKEIFVLTMRYLGAGLLGGAPRYWSAQQPVIACANKDGLLYQEHIPYLTWLMTDEECKTKEKIFDLQPQTIYRLKVRESLAIGQLPHAHSLLVVDVLQRNCHHPMLEKELEIFRNPVSFFLEGFGEMTLDKEFNMFCGKTLWNGFECSVSFDTDDDNENTAKEASRTACSLLADCKNWDEKARKYAAHLFAEDATEWKMDSDEFAGVDCKDIPPISEEEFANRLTISEICISNDGSFQFYYDDDDMFWGHVVIVRGDLETGLEGGEIAG